MLKATTILEAPYVIKKPGVENPSKLEDYEGYIPDLLQKISAEIDRKFTLKVVGDGKYGAKDSTGRWNGMIGEVHDGHADVAAAPLTVSDERTTVVDFTEHFMTFDTVVLLKKVPGLSIHSALELYNNSDITCEVVKDGFTENFFKTAKHDIYRNMYDRMKRDRFPLTAAEGVKRVREGNGRYAFVIESSTADYWKEKEPCELTSFRLGSALPHHNYSFAVKKSNNRVLQKINEAITTLKSRGEHDVLKAKWWPTQCSTASQPCSGCAIASILSGLTALFIISSKRL
jgi:ABC-type amino acid transport substrate-binding protein